MFMRCVSFPLILQVLYPITNLFFRHLVSSSIICCRLLTSEGDDKTIHYEAAKSFVITSKLTFERYRSTFSKNINMGRVNSELFLGFDNPLTADVF